VAELTLDALGCAGKGLLSWSAIAGDAFDHYAVVRAPSSFAIPSTMPPAAPAAVVTGSVTGNAGDTTFVDPGLELNTWWYRAVAVDAKGRVIGATPAVKLVGMAVAGLGPFSATPSDAGAADVSWSTFDGPAACFSSYRVTWSAGSANPSILGDHDGSTTVEAMGATGAPIVPGSGTWHVRVEAVFVGYGTTVVVGRSDVVEVTIP
jgi:hypothetical protein